MKMLAQIVFRKHKKYNNIILKPTRKTKRRSKKTRICKKAYQYETALEFASEMPNQ